MDAAAEDGDDGKFSAATDTAESFTDIGASISNLPLLTEDQGFSRNP